MAESESANVDAEIPAPAGTPRRLSGLLIFSIFLTMGSFLINQLFLIGPVGGIILALLGRRAAKKDPNVTGPRFAVVALLIAIIAFGFESYLLYRAWPAIKAWEQIRMGPVGTLEKVKERKFDEIHALFAPEFQERVTVEELSKQFTDAFPGEGEIALETATEVKDALYTEDFRRRLEEFFGEDQGEISFIYPVSVEHDNMLVEMLFRLHVARLERAEFKAVMTDLELERKEKPPEKSEKEGSLEEGGPEEPDTGTGG